MPKFTNIYPKHGISVNLPQLCGVGLPGPKAGEEFNTFKEPVAPQLRAWSTESQNKSYIARESCLGVVAPVTGIRNCTGIKIIVVSLLKRNQS